MLPLTAAPARIHRQIDEFVARERSLTAMAITTERDEVTFERLVEPHKRGLHAHCYRMLGSLHDAEDAYQEAMLRAWRALPRLREDAALRAWLYRIATNACLNAIARRPKRVLPTDYGPSSPARHDVGDPESELLWLEPYPDAEIESGYAAPEARYEQREAVELAFVAALQHLPAQQRAVLILREVLGFSARETSASLDTTVAAVNSALQRAHRTVEERLPERSQQETVRALGDERARDLLHHYIDAWERHDVPAIVALLAEDVTVEMPPWVAWWQGRDTVEALLGVPEKPCFEAMRGIPVRANGQLAFASYGYEDGRFKAIGINVVALRGERIRVATGFIKPDLLARFGLPAELA
jgi:RNA polymerase sigma-70 factor (ECF subfamily)